MMTMPLVRSIASAFLLASVLLIASAHAPHMVGASGPSDIEHDHRHPSQAAGTAVDHGTSNDLASEPACHLSPLLQPKSVGSSDAPRTASWPGWMAQPPLEIRPSEPIVFQLPCKPAAERQAVLQRFII